LRSIPLSSSILKFWQDLVFLEAALLADDETKHLAAVITPVLDEFPVILQRDLDTRRGVIQTNARAFVADTRIDDTIRGLFSAVLALVQQNRKRPEFTTLFATHIGDVVRHALRKQIDVAKELADKLAMKIFPDGLRTSQTKALAAVIKRGKAVLEEVRKAEFARVEGRLDIRTWKEEANAVRLAVYGQLLQLAAKTGRGKAWAEGFFPRVSAAAAEEDEGDEGTPEPDAPEAPAEPPTPAEPVGKGKPK
jgi:hypothetical protein